MSDLFITSVHHCAICFGFVAVGRGRLGWENSRSSVFDRSVLVKYSTEVWFSLT